MNKAKVKSFLTLLGCQFVSYSLVTVNFRAVAQANILTALLTDLVFASLNYFVITKIAKDESKLPGFLGFVIGSLLGTYVGILVSVRLSGH